MVAPFFDVAKDQCLLQTKVKMMAIGAETARPANGLACITRTIKSRTTASTKKPAKPTIPKRKTLINSRTTALVGRIRYR
jgi:hypothetical protein